MRLKFRKRDKTLISQVVVQVVGDRAGFEVRVMAEPDLDSGTVAAILRRGADKVESGPGAGGPL